MIRWKMPERRRLLFSFAALASVGGLGSIYHWFLKRPPSDNFKGSSMILQKFSLGPQWPVQEPFLFCVHHKDFYPQGNGTFGPDKALLKGRDMGQDFEPSQSFRMYHGEEVPGFPVHPHRGFETITVVRKGYVDHADSIGAAGRYGEGDVQWMTAGAGVQHSEMFPMLKNDQDNALELFQIWLNLPKRSKMVPAHFKMFWSENIPQIDHEKVKVSLIAGQFESVSALTPPPDSWAARPENEVMILLAKVKEGGELTLPRTKEKANRTIYFFEGQDLEINGETISAQIGVNLDSSVDLKIRAQTDSEILLLQARSIGEPVVQYGPFVMNTREDIVQTVEDYRRTEFGGWPWNRHDMVHGPQIERFAKYPDGRIEKPQKA